MMGGERFDTTQPEAYLFGENPDLNFLGCRPVPVSILLHLLLTLFIDSIQLIFPVSM